MLNQNRQSVVRAQLLGHLPFGRFEVATGGIISKRHEDEHGSQITIITGYSRTPVHGAYTKVLFDVGDDVLSLIVDQQRAAAASTEEAIPKAAVSIPLRDRISRVKAGFGFSSKEMAAVLRCSRASLYNWLAEDHQGQVRDEKLARLFVLERLVGQWNAFEVGNLAAHLHTAVVEHADGHRGDLYSLLTNEAIDEGRAYAAFQAIANLSRQQITESHRISELIARGFGT